METIMKKYILLILVMLTSMLQWSCESMLDVKPYAEMTPSVVQTEAGIKALLFSSYRNAQNSVQSRWMINDSEVTTDMGYNTGGQENLQMVQLINFTWDPSLGTFLVDLWEPHYRVIRDANMVLENIDNAAVSEATRKLYTAEARALRAYAFELLYKFFGPVPLRTSTLAPGQLARATDEEMRAFIETELSATIADLPDPGKEEAYGRFNKGTAYGILAKYYLNTKQWQKAVDASNSLIALNYYGLFDTYEKMFTVANEGNKEMIMVLPCLNVDNYGNWYTAGALPPDFKTSSQVPEYTWVQGMANFATQYRLRSALVNSFDFVNDRRAILVLRSYVKGADGTTVDLMATADNARSLKYWDNATVNNNSGNDVPVIRYADILLTKAEALNEISGPTQESLDLINEVRDRANLDDLTLTDATSKEVYRDLILRERGWEFVAEGKRREDLLRHDKFISLAKARGVTNASDKHKLFPIPQGERDTNKIWGSDDY
jgi:starch-binding outer membrane protein, SusD/RagB family